MKAFLLPICFLLYLSSTFSQIEISSFEEWDTSSFYPTPVGWITNQSAEFQRLEKSTDAKHGEFSCKLIPSATMSSDDCSSRMEFGFAINDSLIVDKSLYFYVKAISAPNSNVTDVYCEIETRFHTEGSPTRGLLTRVTQPINDYFHAEVDLKNITTDSISLIIEASGKLGTGNDCTSLSEIWLDDFRIADKGGFSSNADIKEYTDVILYPNPSTGVVNLKQDNSPFERYQLLDFSGKFIREYKLSDFPIFISEPGIYLLRMGGPKVDYQMKKLIITEAN